MQAQTNMSSKQKREYVGISGSVQPPTNVEKIRPTKPSSGRLYVTPPDGWERSRLYASGRIDAEGRGSIGVLPLQQEKISEKREERDREAYDAYTCTRWHYEDGEVTVEFVPAWCSNRFISSSELEQDPLHEARARTKYGLKGITSYGARRVRQSAAILERRYPGNVALYTLTIPSLGRQKVEALSSVWNKLMHHFFIKMGRLYAARGANFHYVACYEVQGKRLENRGEYALHTHYLAPSRVRNSNGKMDWIVTADELRDIWRSIIRAELSVIPDDPRVTSASVDCQQVRQSAQGYLGKYMSKGSEECGRLVAMGLSDVVPAQWWSCSKSLKNACKLWERQLNQEEVDDLLYLCFNRGHYGHVFDYVSAVYANIGGREVCVGYSFKLAENNPLYNFESLRKSLDVALALLVR